MLPALGVLTPAECRQAVDLEVIVLIAAAFGLGAAMEQSGLAQAIASGIFGAVGAFGPIAALLAVVLTAIVLTETVTNNAAAVLVFPIAVSAAEEVGGDVRVFAIALAVAASASFLTPIGYQTNTMVYGQGGYRFSDFARLGAPLTLVVILTIAVVVPLYWGL
jgi:di/tricarboxylate transporter